MQEVFSTIKEAGVNYISNADLICAISGASKAAVQTILNRYQISSLSGVSTNEYRECGFTEKQALRLAAAMNLHTRIVPIKNKITSSKDAYSNLGPKIGHLEHEEFWIMMLSNSNTVLRMEKISSGGMTATVVDIRMVAKKVIETPKCVSVILAHNHPSGSLKPSGADNELTQKIKNGLAVLDIKTLDHIIVSGEGYYSYADEGSI